MTPVAIYARISTQNRQDYDRQVADLTEYAKRNDLDVVEVIAEKVSGTVKDREGITRLYDLVNTKKIQKVLVTEVSRLGRSPSQVLKILEDFTEQKVSIFSQNFGLETLTLQKKLNPAASLIYTLYAEIARMERETLRDRVISGLENARRKGKVLGRRSGSKQSAEKFLQKYPKAVRRLKEGRSLRETCVLAEVSINTAGKLKSILNSSTPH
ncbi:MAG: recombinase family protein [Chitinophagaceae bacterium]|nr:MAG: recombinase family protein [Chitinophagaceae bacterium]